MSLSLFVLSVRALAICLATTAHQSLLQGLDSLESLSLAMFLVPCVKVKVLRCVLQQPFSADLRNRTDELKARDEISTKYCLIDSEMLTLAVVRTNSL